MRFSNYQNRKPYFIFWYIQYCNSLFFKYTHANKRYRKFLFFEYFFKYISIFKPSFIVCFMERICKIFNLNNATAFILFILYIKKIKKSADFVDTLKKGA